MHAERGLAHAQAGVRRHVCLWGELVSLRDGQTGGQNHHETGRAVVSNHRATLDRAAQMKEY